jgi:hypothetical protein
VYHLYYSASTFGVNVSCIGHATRTRMDSGSWTDHEAAGHNAVIFSGTSAFNVYHAYPTDGSYARLRVADLVWDDQGWPRSAGP